MPNPPTANMGIITPTEGGDDGDWDRIANDAFERLDLHDHSSGLGVKVKTNGLDINADLTFASGGSYSALTNVKAVDFQPHAASAMSAYAGAFFVNSTDANNLYFRTQAGSNVRITNGATLDTTTSGGIGGDYAAIPAELNFVDASKTYTHKSSAAGPWSRIQSGPIRIAEFGTTEATYVEIAAPAVLGSSYTLTMPSAVPGSSGTLLQVTSGGTVSFSNTGISATTFGSTVAVTGLITATAGATAAAGQHFTVSGAGEYKHGDRILNLGLAPFGAGGTVGLSGANYFVNATGGGENFLFGIPLKVGDRIKSITAYYVRAGGTEVFDLRKKTLATGSESSVSSTSVASGTTYTSATLSAINYTLISTEGVYFNWDSGAAASQIHFVTVTYDRP